MKSGSLNILQVTAEISFAIKRFTWNWLKINPIFYEIIVFKFYNLIANSLTQPIHFPPLILLFV